MINGCASLAKEASKFFPNLSQKQICLIRKAFAFVKSNKKKTKLKVQTRGDKR
jgi:hypothetical protein